MKKEFSVTLKILSFILVAYSFTMGTNSYADSAMQKDKEPNITHQKFLRFTDSKEEYGKFCEEYSYISSVQRLKLLKHNNFMLGDIISDFSLYHYSESRASSRDQSHSM